MLGAGGGLKVGPLMGRWSFPLLFTLPFYPLPVLDDLEFVVG